MTSTRCLLIRATGELLAYPRQDDEPVVGLDRSAYQVLQVVRLEPPAPETGYQVQALPPVVVIDDSDSDDLNGTATYAWELEALPPPPEPEPEPDWAAFRQALRAENGYAPAFQAALAADPMAGVQLAIGLSEFRKAGDYGDFLEALANALATLPGDQAAHLGLELLALAGRCNLPLAFREALQAMFAESP